MKNIYKKEVKRWRILKNLKQTHIGVNVFEETKIDNLDELNIIKENFKHRFNFYREFFNSKEEIIDALS